MTKAKKAVESKLANYAAETPSVIGRPGQTAPQDDERSGRARSKQPLQVAVIAGLFRVLAATIAATINMCGGG